MMVLLQAGSCVPCSGQGCGHMGLRADEAKPAEGADHVKFYLKTGSSAPYCRQLSFIFSTQA